MKNIWDKIKELFDIFNLGQTFIGFVGSNMTFTEQEIVRPADVNPYLAKDTIADAVAGAVVLSFIAPRITEGTGYITSAQLFTDQVTNTARFRLHLYQVNTVAQNDNVPFKELYADSSSKIGSIDFDAMSTEDAATSTAAKTINKDIRLAYVCGAGENQIFGVLETLDAFVPASGQKFKVVLISDNN